MPAQYSAPAWGASPFEDLQLPSGGLIRAKRLDLNALVQTGLMEEFDTLSPTVEEKVVGPARGKKPQDRQPKKLTKKQREEQEAAETRKLLQSKDDMEAIGRLLARLLPAVVVAPAIQSHMVESDGGKWVPLDPDDREDGVIYTDTIPLADQMHILQWSMEGMDMEEMRKFREQPEQPVDAVEDVADVPDETE